MNKLVDFFGASLRDWGRFIPRIVWWPSSGIRRTLNRRYIRC